MKATILSRHPEFNDLIEILRHEISQAQRPAKEVILTEERVMKILDISKRTLQYMKAKEMIPFEKLGSRSYYRLNDILNLLSQNRIESATKNRKA